MPIENAFATHPGRTAEAAEKKNEDFAHAWIKDKVSYQIIADGNSRSDYLNPASFVVNEIQRFIDTYSEPGMTIAEIKRMISGAFHCANRVLLAFKKANGELYAEHISDLNTECGERIRKVFSNVESADNVNTKAMALHTTYLTEEIQQLKQISMRITPHLV